MKRINNSNCGPVLKEPKLEIPDDCSYFEKGNNLPLFTEEKPKSLLNIFQEEEVPEEKTIPENKNGLKIPKVENEFFEMTLKEPKMEITEEKPLKNQYSAPIWKPKIKSVTDYLNDDNFDEIDCGVPLGSSVLFDSPAASSSSSKEKSRKKKSASPAKEKFDPWDEEGSDYYEEISDKRIMPINKVRAEFVESFERNCHPTALEMQKLAEHCGVRYRTVLEYFQNRRNVKKIKCKPNDPCERIKQFIEKEGEQVECSKMSDEVRVILEDEIEKQILSRKRFSLGFVHIIMEKTDLAPCFVRSQYENWKRKLLTKDRDDYRIQDWRNDAEENNLFSIETLRQLEEAYLQKKYHCEEKEWGPKDIKSLAANLKLDVKRVESWINKRKDATLGLEHNVIELRRDKDARVNAACGRKLPTHKVEVLNFEFSLNKKPNRKERLRISQQLDLSEKQVKNYFNNKRISVRKSELWEKARQEFLTLPEDKVEELEKVATEKRKPSFEYMEIARRLGVSYTTLNSFVAWRKSLTAARLNKFHF